MKDPGGFIEDLAFEGMNYALLIRSPIARGTLKEIKCPKLPHSYQLVSAEQIPGKNQLADFPVPVLPQTRLSYIGQPAAILTGPDVSKLEEFAARIELIVDEDKQAEIPVDVMVRRDIVSGEPDKVLGETEKIVSGAYSTGIQEHWYSEPHGALAVPSVPSVPLGSLIIYTATQWPYHVKRSVSGVLGLNGDEVTVHPTLIALHLDGKIWYPSLVACHAALAAWITHHPVMLMLTRVEDFMYSPKRNKAEIEISSALEEKGRILASDIQIKLDLGSDGVFEDEIIDHSCMGALGLYNHGAFKISGIGMRTNIPPQGPMAGFGLAQGFFAAERHVSRIAESLGQDPAEWRKNNFLGKNQSFAIGITPKESAPLVELIDSAAAMSDYYRKWASYELLKNRRRGLKTNFTAEPLRGIGISIACQGNGFLYPVEAGNNCAVEMTLDKDGSLEIRSSLISSGMGYLDNWKNMAQEILGVEPRLIRLTNNTLEAPDSAPGTLSRNIGIVTRLVELCCSAIRKQRFRDPLPITVKRSSKPGKIPGWVDGKSVDPEAFSRPGGGAVVVEIEIDSVSLEGIIRGIWFAADGGKILSPARATRSIRIGIIQALGWTCRENINYADGQIPHEIYRYYNIPSPAEIPPIKVDFIRNDNSSPKGIGDLPFCCIPAAYVQAVSQAMDHHFTKIPLSSSDIWEAGKQKNTESEP